MTGQSLLNPKSSERGRFHFMILVEYLGHGIIHPVSVFIFLQISFWERP